MAPHLRSLLRIEVQSQATYGYGKEDKENFVGSASRAILLRLQSTYLTISKIEDSYLDHALVLVDRKVADTVKPTFRIPILVVEHKVRPRLTSEWTLLMTDLGSCRQPD